MKLIYFIIWCLFINVQIFAQDFHFSQYQWSPLYVNPALTGNIDNGQHRLIIKHRNQWSSVLDNENSSIFGNQAFKTYMVSYDSRQCESDFFAYGLSLVADVAGQPTFRTYQPQASVAFHMGLKNDAHMSVGFQAGAVHHRFDNRRLTFDNQFDPNNGYDPNANPQEEFLERPSITYFDLGGGVAIYQMDNELGNFRMGYNIGASVTHLGTRQIYPFVSVNNADAIYDRGERLLRWTGHATFVFYENKYRNKRDITFRNLLMLQGPHWQYVPLLEYGMMMKGNAPFLQKVAFGAGARITKSNTKNSSLADAILLNVQTDLGENTSLNVGYDVNISPLAQASKGFGSFEISLLFRFKTDAPCVKCFGF